MALQLFNTKTRKVEEFKPLKDNEVRMYSCGPTVYNYAHIGNFRAYVFADLLKRYLLWKGYKVIHVMNITDIDDKTIRDSQKEGKSLKEFTEFYTKAFFEDIKTLNILPADYFPRATEHINEMIELIKKLEEKGHTYKSPEGSVYYKITTFQDYGKLAHLDFSHLKVNAQGRLDQDEYDKDDARDFALWKAYTPEDGDVYFDTCYGKGRPGWHIECSAMSMKYLGESFDIHTGGVDLIFPHHTNEIAQSEGATGKEFVNFWLHNEHLLVENKKMSKSLGNFYTLRDLLAKGYDPKAIRWLLLNTHYRQKLNFTFEGLEAAKHAIERLQEVVDKLLIKEENAKEGTLQSEIQTLIEEGKKGFEQAMDNDLHIAEALASIFETVKEINKRMEELTKADARALLELFKSFDTVLGVLSFEKTTIPKEVISLAEERKQARDQKDWQKADALREKIKSLGYDIYDNKDGTYLLKKRG